MKGVRSSPICSLSCSGGSRTPPREFVCIAEGEKDVEALWDLQMAATCNVGSGRNKWRDEYTEWFKGRKVVVFQDNDEAGRRHAQKVAAVVLRGRVQGPRDRDAGAAQGRRGFHRRWRDEGETG